MMPRNLGYHPNGSFSQFEGILHAIGPDPLYRVFKCFMHHMLKEWIWKIDGQGLVGQGWGGENAQGRV